MILRFLNHYHGSSDNLLGGNFRDIQNPLAYDEGNTIFSTEGRAQNILENEMFILPWNDLSVIEDFVLRHKNEIGAIIMELVMLNGGGETVQPEYLKKVRELCTKYNIVLIFDEIITGIRMGLGSAQKMYGITPDLTIYGKSISNGYMPVSILMGKREIMQQYETGSVVHGGTYNGYALGMVTVNSTIDILMESNYYKRILNIGNMLISIIKDEASKLGLPIFIKGHETWTFNQKEYKGCKFYCLHFEYPKASDAAYYAEIVKKEYNLG